MQMPFTVVDHFVHTAAVSNYPPEKNHEKDFKCM